MSNILDINPSQPCKLLKKQIELLSDAFIADNVRAKNLGIPKQVLKAQMIAAEKEAILLFQKRYLLKVASCGKSPLYKTIRIIFKVDSIYNQVKAALNTAIEQAAKLNSSRSRLYLANTDPDFNTRIDRLSKQPIEGDSCLKYPMSEIMKDLMRKHDII